MYTDRPIDNNAKDLYDRWSFAKMIGDTLLLSYENYGLCVGLSGPWGSGKTSVINMVQEYIESEEREPKVTVMRFEPWNFTSADQLICQFFSQLAEFFDVKDAKKKAIGEAITQYASGLDTNSILSLITNIKPEVKLGFQFFKTGLKRLGNYMSERSFENISVQKQKEKLHKLLKEMKERIIIFIDDIDRLTSEQIRCVFQLVTIICKFPNISYLLSFDRIVVAKALDKYQDGKGDVFLNKVIQVPIVIPSLRKNALYTTMSEYLNDLIKSFNIEFVDLDKWRLLYEYCTVFLIKTHRDILLLYNELKSKMILLANDVDFVDLLMLTIIEQHEPRLYQWIEQHKDMLTGQITVENMEDHEEGEQAKIRRREKYIAQIRQNLMYNEYFTSELALKVVCILFPQFSEKVKGENYTCDEEDARARNCLCDPTKVGRYFSLNVEKEDVSNIDLAFIINDANKEEVQKSILLHDGNRASINLFDEIKLRIDKLDKERIKLLAYSIEQIGDVLKTTTSNGLAIRKASDEAILIVNDLLLQLSEDERFVSINEMIQNINIDNIDTLSCIMHRISLAYDKTETEKDKYNVIPTLKDETEYRKLEEQFLNKLVSIINKNSIEVLLDKTYFVHYYTRYKNGKEYIRASLLSDPIYVIKYLATTVGRWKSNGKPSAIEIKEKYKMVISDEEIEKAISELVDTGRFNDMDIDLKRIAVAYMMKKEEGYKDSITIDLEEIDRRITEMKR